MIPLFDRSFRGTIDQMSVDEQDGDDVSVPVERCKPQISHLDDAIDVVTGEPRLKVGIDDRIVIERSIMLEEQPRWFDTRWYQIKAIDHSTGAIRLWDISDKRFAMTNYRTVASNPLYAVKVVEIEKKERGKDEPPGRTVYDNDGRLYTRYKKIVYNAPIKTLAQRGTKVDVKLETNGSLTVSDPKMGWIEQWRKE